MPNVSYFCAFCVQVGYNPISGSESPEHGDDPRHQNLEKFRVECVLVALLEGALQAFFPFWSKIDIRRL